MIGNTEFTDDMAHQGSLEFRYYTKGAPGDGKRHSAGCPGCDPKAKDNPIFDIWFQIEAKWRARGEPPTCPKERQQWYREQFGGRPWWREERDGKAHYDPAR